MNVVQAYQNRIQKKTADLTMKIPCIQGSIVFFSRVGGDIDFSDGKMQINAKRKRHEPQTLQTAQTLQILQTSQGSHHYKHHKHLH